MHVEQRPQRTVAIRACSLHDAVIDVARFALLGHEAGVLQQAEVSRDVRLRNAQDAGELGDIEPIGREDAKQPQPRRVGKEPRERGRLLHIYKSTYIDTVSYTHLRAHETPE